MIIEVLGEVALVFAPLGIAAALMLLINLSRGEL